MVFAKRYRSLSHSKLCVESDAMRHEPGQHVVDAVQVYKVVLVVEENAINYLDTVEHVLKCHVVAKINGVTRSCETQGNHPYGVVKVVSGYSSSASRIYQWPQRASTIM